MADILIRGMEMPKTESVYVELRIWGDGTVYEKLGPGLAWKPEQIGIAIPLPSHGRCIDADALIREKSGEATLWCGYEYQDHSVVFEEDIKNAPTIVPAEGGSDNG